MIRPLHVVIGTTDLAASTAFYGHFGFEPVRRALVPAAAVRVLYGLESDAREVILAQPGAERGWVRLVETPTEALSRGPFDRGAHSIEIYVPDVAAAVDRARSSGLDASPVFTHTFASEARVAGPDGVTLVLAQAEQRRPSLIDRLPGRRYSEIHGVMWVVDSIDHMVHFWRIRFGLDMLRDVTMRQPAIAHRLGLPRHDAPARFALLSDRIGDPIRVMFLEFPDDRGKALPKWPLRGGIHAIAFDVSDLESARASIGGALIGMPVALPGGLHGAHCRVAAGVMPGAVGVEFWEMDAS